MDYNSLFEKYGCSRLEDAEHRIYVHVYRPEKLDTTERIKYYDDCANRNIAEMESYISALREYRIRLAARYAELETMTYSDTLKLEREKRWSSGKVFYYVSISRIYSDGTKQDVLFEKFNGSERHEAKKRFESLKKERPGIKSEINIEKSKWEK